MFPLLQPHSSSLSSGKCPRFFLERQPPDLSAREPLALRAAGPAASVASCPFSCLYKSRSARRLSEAGAPRRGNGSRLQKTTALAAQARLLPHRAIEKPALTQPFPAVQQRGFCLIPRSGQCSCVLGGRRPLTYASSQARGLGLAQMEVKPRCEPTDVSARRMSPHRLQPRRRQDNALQCSTGADGHSVQAGPPLRQQWT